MREQLDKQEKKTIAELWESNILSGLLKSELDQGK